MTPPEGLPPLPPNTYYGGQLKDHEGDLDGYCFQMGCDSWTHFSEEWAGMKDSPNAATADWHIAIPLPKEDAKTEELELCEELEKELNAAREELAETEKAFSESQQALAVEINEVERLREENRRLREWQPITGEPVNMKMIIACAINPTSISWRYTTDPWVVWWDDKNKVYVRWPHHFPPTHFTEIPTAPEALTESKA